MKLTKNELKKQKEQLKQFNRYLPTLILKKQQLLIVIKEIEREIETLLDELKAFNVDLEKWVDIFSENNINLEDLIKIKAINKSTKNIAGVNVPVFESLDYDRKSYDSFIYPLYTEKALDALSLVAHLDAKVSILEQQIKALNKELITTSQRVNLFEKVKIPEAKQAIKKIGIYLGDQMTASVVRGKIAKQKLMRVSS